jgi:hypothetical protein
MTQKIQMFTSSAVNYLPKVRLLCESIKRYHPEWMVHWALADRMPAGLSLELEPIDQIIPVESLSIPGQDGWIFRHTIVELSTGIKPFVVRYLLDQPGTTAVLYFDPDMVLFSRLDDLVAGFDKHSILLTPHQTKPETDIEAVIDNEICSLRHGIFNLGFLGIRNDKNGREFIDWWAERVYHFCHESLEQHLFTDQKWVNFAPVFFDGVGILKSSRFNVATWNITTRAVTGSFSEGFQVDGHPLGFYHFTGFDSGAHKIMAIKNGGDNSAVKALVRWYEEQNQRHTNDSFAKLPWAFSTFTNGDPVTQAHRVIYRSRRDLQQAYPRPFDTEPASNFGAGSYHEWFKVRAPIEYPDKVGGKQEDVSPSTTATSMNQGERFIFGWDRIRKHLRMSLRSQNYMEWTIKRAWQLWRSEGTIGFLARLCRHPERPI